ncbi:MAG TPA: acyl-CoA dehydrogenase family protein, partial [Candidatus Dormibacteraeota bacterium]|nr:acyl-CoA dehydrogenase family protein [Candidatus Dormibacteraeota bacterium]
MDKEEQTSLLHDVAEFCKELRPVEEVCYVEHTFNEQLIPLCRKYSLLGIPIRKEYGGRGADSLTYARALDRIGMEGTGIRTFFSGHTSIG